VVLSQLIPTPHTSPPATPKNPALWVSETPQNLYELDKQEELVRKAILDISHSPGETREAISKISKACGDSMVEIALLNQYVAELKGTVEALSKKRRQTGKQLQKGGTLTVGRVQELIAIRDQSSLNEEALRDQPRNTQATRKCGLCK
jgi:hypothetical protein